MPQRCLLATLAISSLGLTDGGEENDGEEISDGLCASRHLGCDHVTLGGQQRSCQETAKLHGNVQKLCHLQSWGEGGAGSTQILPSPRQDFLT